MRISNTSNAAAKRINRHVAINSNCSSRNGLRTENGNLSPRPQVLDLFGDLIRRLGAAQNAATPSGARLSIDAAILHHPQFIATAGKLVAI